MNMHNVCPGAFDARAGRDVGWCDMPVGERERAAPKGDVKRIRIPSDDCLSVVGTVQAIHCRQNGPSICSCSQFKSLGITL